MSDVVLVHGTTQNAAGFWPLSHALHQRGHRTLTVDVPAGLPTASSPSASSSTTSSPRTRPARWKP